MAHSPYAAPRHRPKWPWIAGLIVVLAIAAFAGVAASTAPFTDNDLDNRVAEIQQTAVADTPTVPATPTPAATEAPPDPDAPRRTVDAWFAAWTNGDYAGMYRLTSDTTRTVLSEEEFVERYSSIRTEAGVKAVTATVTGEPNADGAWPYQVTFESSYLGEFSQESALPLVEEGREWRVAWTPSLIFSQLGDTGCVDWQGQPIQRGRILDADGDVLAEDAEVAQVGIVPGDIVDESIIDRLGEIIDMNPDDIRAIYQKEGIDPGWVVPIKNLPADQAIDLINQVKDLKGVQVQRAFSRVYPHGPLFAHVTGYVSPALGEDVLADETGSIQSGEMVGRSGLEYGANEILAGKPGGKLLVVECETRQARELIAESEGVAPLDIQITIDIDFQKQVDEAVGNVDTLASVPGADADATAKKDDRGSAVVIDPRSGAILAMVSHPTYDPNNFVTGSFSDEELARINDPQLSPLLNRAASATYPAGSIFKVITTAAAMANLGYTGETPIDCPASYTIGDVTWNDWVVENGLSAQGQLTLHTGLVRSCNTVFYQIGHKLDDEDPNLLPDMTKAFGLGSPTGIAYFPEASGVVPDPNWKQENIGDGWATGDNVNLSIGQGYLLTSPLQMANAYAAIANGGDLLQPYIVDKALLPGTDQVEQIGQRTVIHELPLTDDQIAMLQGALRDQTSNDAGVGSSRIFGDFTWPIAGKTGTAQNGPQDNPPPPHSWFAAYGPAGEEATIASVVMFEQVGEGVQYAAPVTKAIYQSYIADATQQDLATADGSS